MEPPERSGIFKSLGQLSRRKKDLAWLTDNFQCEFTRVLLLVWQESDVATSPIQIRGKKEQAWVQCAVPFKESGHWSEDSSVKTSAALLSVFHNVLSLVNATSQTPSWWYVLLKWRNYQAETRRPGPGRIDVMRILLQDMVTWGRGALDVVVIKSCPLWIQRECNAWASRELGSMVSSSHSM